MPDKNSFEPSAKKPKVEIDLNNLVKQEKDSDESSSPGRLEQEQRVQEQLLPTVQLFGTDIPYRRCGKILLFSTAAVVALIRAWLPIAADLQQIINSLQTQNRGEPLKSSLISWGSLKLLLKGSLYDLALGNVLSHYRPFGKSPRCDGEDELCTLNGVLKIGNQGIQFYVQYGKVFLSCEDVMRVCRERGEEVDNIKPGRNNTNLYKVDGVVDDEMRTSLEDIEQQVKDTKLGSVLRHLLKQVDGVKEKREQMEKEMEQTVSMINRQSITEQACTYDSTDNESKSTLETDVADSSYVPKRTYKECNNTQCGRTYHFILSCCTREHTLNLMDQRIPFMYHQGKIYLEKCAAFEAIGKTNIIRCSNYRRVDKILIEHGLSPAAEFLQQDIGRKSRRRSGAAGRNRRNHVSLDALTLLVQVNFVMPGRQEELLAGLEQFSSNPPPPCSHINQGELENEMDARANDLEKDEEEEEEKNENIAKDEQSSSGVESEESGLVETPVGSPESVHEVVDLKPVPKSKQQIKTVAIQNMQVPFKVANGQVFLKKHFVFSLLHIKDASRKSSERLEKLLVQIEFPLEKAFLYEGRIANYISTHAVKCILSSVPDISTELGRVELDALLVELETVEGNIDNLTTIKHLQLKTMGTIRFQVQAGVVYFDTLKLMKLAEIHLSLVRNSPSKANSFVKKLLQDRGINVVSCFLKQRNSKYAFINLRSSLILLQYSHETEQKEKAHRLKKELLLAAHARNILNKPGEGLVRCVQNTLKISNTFPNLKYKIKAGRMYFHRKTVFDCIGLESLVLGNKKGFLPLNAILTDLGLDFSQVYLSSQQEVFAYISAPALLLLLESTESFLVLLNKKQDFLAQLLLSIEFSVCAVLGNQETLLVENHKIPIISREGRLYLDKEVCFSMSRLSALSEWAEHLDVLEAEQLAESISDKGLEIEKDFQRKGSDSTGFIGIHALLSLFSQECDGTRSRDAHSLLLRDSLSAVSVQEPRLRSHIRMSHFRLNLVNRLVSEYLRSLQEAGGGLEVDTEQEESGLELDNNSDDEFNPGGGDQPDQELDQSQHLGCENEDEDATIQMFDGESPGTMDKIRAELVSLAGGEVGGNIGDWELVSIQPVTHLSVRPGYGASRKLSFLQPDVAAILRYDLYISRDTGYLCINDRRINSEIINKIVEKGLAEGSLSLLYQLISLRPCFGSFSPEQVESVNQSLEQSQGNSFLTVDTNFIGTSSHGRTYAGTVRSVDCTFLAESRVADRCLSCTKLDGLVINRSILAGEVGAILNSSKSGSGSRSISACKPSHQSVWKLDTTDEKGCSFLCPQVQTFNTSLPHAFVGSAQATTIVDHRVEISDKLVLKVELNSAFITREFPQFTLDRQLGPLLDSVAALRLCVGYPASRLVHQTRFLLNHQGRLIPETRKLFRLLVVDENFTYRSGVQEERGTIRSTLCCVEAENGSDICTACRALQQPLEFQ